MDGGLKLNRFTEIDLPSGYVAVESSSGGMDIKGVAVIGDVNYTSLSAAVKAADESNSVIELLGNVHEDNLVIDKDLTIAGNNKSLYGNIIFNAVGSDSYR